MTETLGRLLGYDNVQAIDRVTASFAALWARRLPALLVLGLIGLLVLSVLFYTMSQRRGRRSLRWLLAISRAVVLGLILLFLAEPNLVVHLTNEPKPWLWLLFDGTDSMGIRDEYASAERSKLNGAVGRATSSLPPAEEPSRMEDLQAFLKKSDKNLLRSLSEEYRLKAFLFDRPDVVRELTITEGDSLSPDEWSQALTAQGQVTALGKSFEDLALRHASGHLAGVLVASDFDQNSGPPAVASAKKLGVPVYTLGLGAEANVDLAVDLQAPLILKKAERASFVATVRQTGLTDREVLVRLTARSQTDTEGVDAREIGSRVARLSGPDIPVEFPWTPDETGRFVLEATVEAQPGELVTQNNTAEREIDIRDDFLRLMFVEYEPTWEWRFIKEVFHRDKLVGIRGFRTFLRSADPTVRKNNELFLPTLTPKRSDFFANDVIFLGDMPAATLSTRFCEMTREFVSTFGGGLVIVSGPRFGPGQLASTPLADMLPVVVDPGARVRDDRPFRLRLTADAGQYDFMQLGAGDHENALAWNNLGELPWYQPVSRLHPLATALAVHPSDLAIDGKSPQPLIAVRRYGRGEVIYIGFNETWRLRRQYGEQFYRQFWGQMIHRLGLSHALGSQKRFVVRTDRQQYQPDDPVLVTVEAYDANFDPLTEDDLPARGLTAELTLPAKAGEAGETFQALKIPQFREGVFEARIPVLQSGEHRLTVTDPITEEKSDVFFQVTNISVERRSAVRNVALQREIAAATGGQAYDLTTIDRFTHDFQPKRKVETTVQVFSLWHPRINTWIGFSVIVVLLLFEWLVRKQINLP